MKDERRGKRDEGRGTKDEGRKCFSFFVHRPSSLVHRRDGSILILALWCISFLSILSLVMGYGVRQKAALTDRLESVAALRDIAYSGIEDARALFQTEDADPAVDTLLEDWSLNEPMFKDVRVGPGRFWVGYAVLQPDGAETPWYGLIDEDRKINLNAAEPADIQRLLELAGGAPPEDAVAIAHAVVDWRDPDFGFQHPQYGAEDDDYKGLPLPYEAKDARFEAVEELLLIMGMKREIFDKIEPYATVFGPGIVNVNTAPREVLMSLGMSRSLADKILLYRAGDDLKTGTADDRYFSGLDDVVDSLKRTVELEGADESTLGAVVNASKIGVTSTYYRARSTGVLEKNGASLTMEAVMDRKGRIFYSKTSGVRWPNRG